MKTKIISIFFSLVLVCTGMSSVLAFAEPGSSEKGRPFFTKERKMDLLGLMMDLADLNITLDQRTAVRAILRKHWDEAKPLLKELNLARKELRGMIRNTPYNEEGIRALVYKRASSAADLAVMRAKISAEVQAVLTPKQKEKIRLIMDRIDQRISSVPDRIEERLNQE